MRSTPPLRNPVAGILAALALYVLARPYEGVQHDGALYFGQVLRRGLVPSLSQDPFFAGGSQDAYSSYSLLLAPLYRVAGPAIVHQSLLLLSLGGTALAVATLLRRLGLSAFWGLLALAVMSPFYGGLRKFGFTENFLTARSLAEPLVVFSLIALLQGRLVLGGTVQLLAMAFHPLMAFPALVVTWMLAVSRDRRWLSVAALPVLAVVLALSGVASLQRLTAIYDASWWGLVSNSNVQVVMANWTFGDGLVVLTDMVLLLLASRSLPTSAEGRRLLFAVLLATAGLLLTHALGTDLLHSVLLTQLQPWRVLWLTHLLATVLAPYLVWRAWQREGLWRLSAALLTLVLINNHAGSSYGAPLLAGWGLISWLASRGVTVSQRPAAFAMVGCALMLLVLNGLQLAFEFERLYWRPPAWLALAQVSHILTAPVLAFGAAGLIATRLPSTRGWWVAMTVVSAIAVVLAVSQWDRRGELARLIEDPPQPTPFAGQIPPEATVLWFEELPGTWGLLRRISHYNRQQGGGMLFNRATAELMAPRRTAYEAVYKEYERCELSAVLGGGAEALARCATPTPAVLRKLCLGPVHPDFLVFEHPLPLPSQAVWGNGRIDLHLYTCAQLSAASF